MFCTRDALNIPEERVQELLPEKEFSKLIDDSLNIFKKSNIGWYTEGPCATFCNKKNVVF